MSESKSETHCDPGCGRGCTRDEFNRAVSAAANLRQQLGGDWQTRIWDGPGGWHYCLWIALSDGSKIEVWPGPDCVGPDSGTYWATLYPEASSFLTHHSAADRYPRTAVTKLYRALRAQADTVNGAAYTLARLTNIP